ANITPTATAAASATGAPTATTAAGLPSGAQTYKDDIPSCDNQGGWQAGTDTTVSCGSNFVTITNPASSHTVAELFFNVSDSFANNYDVAVQITNITGGCAGISVLEVQSAAVVGFVCEDGSWGIIQYSSAGSPSIEASGPAGSVSVSGQTTDLDIVVANFVDFTVDGNRLASVHRPTSYHGTHSMGLVVSNPDNSTTAASADFAAFSYEPRSS
ncbi:MAG TPA: hypothetical protein VKQ36_17805, partial [Ktedonobacterales bacterium]|nr:hypothetical protein [Ktedonobacterales bacterium]